MKKGLFHINSNQQENGQSLAEVLIAVAVGAIIIGSAAIGIDVLLRSNADSRASQTASFLAREYLDKARSLSESDWHNIYNLSPKGTTSTYKIVASGTTGLAIASGTESLGIDNNAYNRYFIVEEVKRSTTTDAIVAVGGWRTFCTDILSPCDPSTQKVTVAVQWLSGGQNREVKISEYFTRWRNKIFQQTDWSGGPNQPTSSPLTEPNDKFVTSTNIDYSSTKGSIKILKLEE